MIRGSIYNILCYLSVAVLQLLFIACATQYKPLGVTGGYSDMQLGENIFKVSFRGNDYTS